MKQALLVGCLVVGMSNLAAAQGGHIHTRYGETGSIISLSAETQSFLYEATVSGTTLASVATLEVYHNGVLKSVQTQMGTAILPFNVSLQVNMASWGLKAGDHVTFNLKVVSVGLVQQLLASHSLTGEVIAAPPSTN